MTEFLLALLFIAIVSPRATWAKEKQAPAGAVVTVKGLAYLASSGSSERRSLKAGSSISTGDVIDTEKDGEVKLLLTDQTIVDLGPSTHFSIDQYTQNH